MGACGICGKSRLGSPLSRDRKRWGTYFGSPLIRGSKSPGTYFGVRLMQKKKEKNRNRGQR